MSHLKKTFLVFSLILLILPLPIFAAEVDISSEASVNLGTNLTLTLNVTNISDLFGAAFELTYNPSILHFVSAQKGSLLEKDGVTTYLIATPSPEGNLLVGYSRQAVGGIATGVNGSGSLMTITFSTVAAGTSNINFQNNALCNSAGFTCNAITT